MIHEMNYTDILPTRRKPLERGEKHLVEIVASNVAEILFDIIQAIHQFCDRLEIQAAYRQISQDVFASIRDVVQVVTYPSQTSDEISQLG